MKCYVRNLSNLVYCKAILRCGHRGFGLQLSTPSTSTFCSKGPVTYYTMTPVLVHYAFSSYLTTLMIVFGFPVMVLRHPVVSCGFQADPVQISCDDIYLHYNCVNMIPFIQTYISVNIIDLKCVEPTKQTVCTVVLGDFGETENFILTSWYRW